jgi:hypothetical protein
MMDLRYGSSFRHGSINTEQGWLKDLLLPLQSSLIWVELWAYFRLDCIWAELSFNVQGLTQAQEKILIS